MVRLQSNIHKKSSYDEANPLSKLVFWWLLGFFFEFQKKRLKISDLETCPKYEKSESVGEKLENEWLRQIKKTKKGSKPSFGWAIFRTIFRHYSMAFVLLFTSSMAPIGQTLSMGLLINTLYSLPDDEAGRREAKKTIYLAAAFIVLTQIFYSFVQNMYWFLARKCGIAVRVACSRLIYHKSLRLSQKAMGQTTVGQIVNLLSNDVGRFDLASEFPFFVIIGPIQVAVCIYFLWPLLGISVIIGLLVLFAYIPFQTGMGRAFGKLRGKGAILTDERVRLMNEFIPAMRVIKMYAWEKPFADLVDRARKAEVAKIRWAAYLRGLNLGLGVIAEKLVMFLMIVSFILMGNHLSAVTIFVAMALVRQLQMSVTVFIPMGISSGAECIVSIRRIRDFLLLPEVGDGMTSSFERIFNVSEKDKESKVIYKNVSTKWKENSEPFLRNISFQVEKGQLLAIVGPVGAGKSTTLLSILGEIVPSSGKTEISGSVSYACQQSWIFAGTVRENILFGAEFDSRRYKRVIRVAALERDMEILPAGDQTIVGDRGASLSGGQRARINLARALYAKADIYLLDDPLSAVDAPVAKHIFENSIKDFLSDKIAILVTHQLQFMKSADRILLLNNGEQVCFGDYTEFLKKGTDFIKHSQISDNESQSHTEDKIMTRKLSKRLSRQSSRTSIMTSDGMNSILAVGETEILEDGIVSVMDDIPDEDEQGVQELAGIGKKKNLFWCYISAGISPFLFPFWMIYMIGAQLVVSFIEYYFSLWTDAEERRSQVRRAGLNETAFEPITFVDSWSTYTNIYFFSGLIVILFAWCLSRNFAFFAVCMRASIKLHDRLFRAIIRAPISFFDNNPPGIVLNRVSRDMGLIDDFLPSTLFDTVFILASNAASIVLMAIINGFLVIPSICLFIICGLIRSRYVNIARDVKRLEGVTKSPVFSHLSTSLYGLATIRAFGAQERFKMIFDIYQNEHSSAYFTWIASSRFFIAAINTMSICFTAAVVLVVLLLLDSFNGSSVGLVISSSIGLASGIQWGMRQLTEVETMMTSVERADELRYIQPEAELEALPSQKPPSTWPQNGEIAFCHVYLRYNPEKAPVLNDLSFRIEAREKVGIVGRTGAGKSSIMTALFRMTEPEGHIIIDDIDIKNIGLHDLRRKISIIPQEPIIFSGSVRYNLDPFSSKKDSDIWDALTQVQLKRTVDEMGGLDSMITDGGTNLSVGQRQLVCLARAILASNKILVLDEATANIDPTTDELIQQTIRKRFSDCTVLTIAHRLQTIMDSDKILVMDAGCVAQFGDPASLVEDKEGIFYSMVQATGKDNAENLIRIAMKTRFREENEIDNFE